MNSKTADEQCLDMVKNFRDYAKKTEENILLGKTDSYIILERGREKSTCTMAGPGEDLINLHFYLASRIIAISREK